MFSKQIKSWKMNPIMILLTLWNSVQWKPNMILHTVSLEEPRVFKKKTIFKATDCGKQKQDKHTIALLNAHWVSGRMEE